MVDPALLFFQIALLMVDLPLLFFQIALLSVGIILLFFQITLNPFPFFLLIDIAIPMRIKTSREMSLNAYVFLL